MGEIVVGQPRPSIPLSQCIAGYRLPRLAGHVKERHAGDGVLFAALLFERHVVPLIEPKLRESELRARLLTAYIREPSLGERFLHLECDVQFGPLVAQDGRFAGKARSYGLDLRSI